MRHLLTFTLVLILGPYLIAVAAALAVLWLVAFGVAAGLQTLIGRR